MRLEALRLPDLELVSLPDEGDGVADAGMRLQRLAQHDPPFRIDLRGLAVEEYAFYTLATSAFTFLLFASNLGATSAFAWFFRETKGDAIARARYDRAVVEVRRLLFALAAPAALGMLSWTALERGFSISLLAAASVAIVGTAWIAIDGVAAIQILRLDDRFGASYRSEVTGAGVRPRDRETG